ncbi:MAG: ribonuclease HI [Chloroflexota bacterium]
MACNVTIYTDGAASGNPGPGGYGIVMISGRHRLEKSQGYKLTTNNRMELMGVIAALESLKIPQCNVTVYTDSRYVADAVEKGWLFQWESKKFKGKKNPDLWLRFLKIYRQHKVKFIWIRGHNSNAENEVCDRLAVQAASGANLPEDEGYNPGENNGFFE